ncbi:MAG: carbamoyltransferase [Nitrospiraceae bacterium]|nr:carbamoyltransferase [Nitrospiraceae bacterium]
MNILGLNAFHADAAACLLVDGALVIAVEEERFRRVKHWTGFPTEAVKCCLRAGGIEAQDLDHIAVNRNPGANLYRRLRFAIFKCPGFSVIRNRMHQATRVRDIRAELESGLGLAPMTVKAQVHYMEHHRAHLASSFFVSPFDSAALASVDGFGDFVSTMVGQGTDNRIQVLDRVVFPHSLGEFYLAMTQYLGFHRYGDEYKVMGLAAYGKPEYLPDLRRIVRLLPKGRFELDLRFFLYPSEGDGMTWKDGEPVVRRIFSDELIKLLGPPREADEPVTNRHENMAASLQAMYEEAFFHILNDLHDRTRRNTLCLAGGCALNSVANGQISRRTPFQHVYVPPAANDAGGAIGAAYLVWHEKFRNPRSFHMDRADWGPHAVQPDIRQALNGRRRELAAHSCCIEEFPDEQTLCRRAAADIAAGKVIGWVEGRMEWGPRALGQRSILADPRREDMKDTLNARIKRRESFRPFAPSILEEAVGDYFEPAWPSPFMSMTHHVRPDKRHLIPSSIHVDGTARVHTVSRRMQPLYWRLIKEFERLTGVPVLLNTSFNEHEPIVCTPEEALDCFLRTQMDGVAIGSVFVSRTTGGIRSTV